MEHHGFPEDYFEPRKHGKNEYGFPKYRRWRSRIDNNFARKFYRATKDIRPDFPPPKECCKRCATILLHQGSFSLANFDTSSKSSETSSTNCWICAELFPYLKDYIKLNCREQAHLYDQDEICNKCLTKEMVISRNGNTLGLDSGLKGLRLCRDVDTINTSPPPRDIQLGFPLPLTGPIYFALLREWLKDCDQNHKDCDLNHDDFRRLRDDDDEKMPTRVLEVGDVGQKMIWLRESASIECDDYIAFSHCWGNLLPEEKHRYSTTPESYEERLNGFSVESLPQQFQDAVQVTQQLGRRYLWVDSLCIIQQDSRDWEKEVARMESVFADAYCVIAAEASENPHQGFLGQFSGIYRSGTSRNYTRISAASGTSIYLCSDLDDYDTDVRKSILSTRAWTLQESVLSRRVIHFCSKQTYFACGKGVRSGNLTKQSPGIEKDWYLLDPKFPVRLLQTSARVYLPFILQLLEEYSKRGLTDKTDRVAAIDGLQTRIAAELDCRGQYAVFEEDFHRYLLWKRAHEQPMKKIPYKQRKIPSWSWIAYDGEIRFPKINEDQTTWSKYLQLAITDRHDWALISELASFRKSAREQGTTNHEVLDSDRVKSGWIQYDTEDAQNFSLDKCIVVGRVKGKHSDHLFHILVVTPTDNDGVYERIGVGLVDEAIVSRYGGKVTLV